MDVSEQDLEAFSAQQQRKLARIRWISFSVAALLLLLSFVWLIYTAREVDKKADEVTTLQKEVEQEKEDLKEVAEFMNEVVESDAVYANAPTRIKEIYARVLEIDTTQTVLQPQDTLRQQDPTWSDIVIQYFPKNEAEERVAERIREALEQFNVKVVTGVGNPKLKDLPVNAVWYGRDVSPQTAGRVALALMRAGVTLQVFKPIQREGLANYIQIGTLANMRDAPLLTPADIRRLSQ